MISPTGGGPGFHIERVLDARPASWATWHLAFAKTEADAITIARQARAEAVIWIQNDRLQRRARRLREESS